MSSSPRLITIYTSCERGSKLGTLHNLVYNLESSASSLELEDKFWLLYFDGSKNQEGSGAGCILIDPEKNKHFLSCRLEFECTNLIQSNMKL